jgi:DNA-binding HxlR family transcriptional regulator
VEGLKQLEKDGIVERRIIPSSPPTVEYNLSKFGQRLMPAILSIAEVGRELQAHRQKSGTQAASASA